MSFSKTKPRQVIQRSLLPTTWNTHHSANSAQSPAIISWAGKLWPWFSLDWDSLYIPCKAARNVYSFGYHSTHLAPDSCERDEWQTQPAVCSEHKNPDEFWKHKTLQTITIWFPSFYYPLDSVDNEKDSNDKEGLDTDSFSWVT